MPQLVFFLSGICPKMNFSIGNRLQLKHTFVLSLRAQLFTSLNILRCLNGTFPWRNCSVNDLIKNLFKDIVKEQFLYRIVSLWHLVYRKFLSLPWQRSFILEVNSFAPNLFGFLNSRIKWYFCPMTKGPAAYFSKYFQVP